MQVNNEAPPQKSDSDQLQLESQMSKLQVNQQILHEEEKVAEIVEVVKLLDLNSDMLAGKAHKPKIQVEEPSKEVSSKYI